MTTSATLTNITTNFDDAIAMYSDDARDLFSNARAAIPAHPITADTAESELIGAFTQMSGAALMQYQQRSRAGFDAVVDLMETTADAAGKISAKLVTLLHAEPSDPDQPQAGDYKLIDELKASLEVLSRLSPSAVWTAPGGATNES
jgi:hypothetical protein